MLVKNLNVNDLKRRKNFLRQNIFFLNKSINCRFKSITLGVKVYYFQATKQKKLVVVEA